MTADLTERIIASTDCPFCGAAAGQPCRKIKGYGRISYIHNKRWRKYATPMVLSQNREGRGHEQAKPRGGQGSR